MGRHFPMRFSRLACTWAAVFGATGVGWCQEAPPIGLLLDTSPEMGFLVAQARKEIRWNNNTRVSRGQQTLPVIEFAGASLEREGSLSLPARRNALYPIRELLEDRGALGLYWITALRGLQSGEGLFAVESLLSGGGERPSRPLLLRHIWQEQAQMAVEWARHPPEPDQDPLALASRPFDWYRLAKAGRGVVIRSWQVPPPEELTYFGFPHRITVPQLLRKLNIQESPATMDDRWKQELSMRLGGLVFALTDDVWPTAITGRRWLAESVLVPHLDRESIETRNEAVFEGLRARESIEEDLSRIPAQRLGVLFGFGYVGIDLERARNLPKPGRNPHSLYLADLIAIVRETREHLQEHAPAHPERVYATEYLDLPKAVPAPDLAGNYARRMARMVREEKVDAIYFFTNGYSGGEYGRFEVDLPLIAAAIREANVPLYVRVPFELGVVPMALQRLALASGGGVFWGKADDPDWKIAAPTPAWPPPPVVP